MSFLSWNKKQSPVSLLLDIGNGSVGGALALMHTGSKPEILYSTRIPLSLDEKPSAEQLESALFQYLDVCLKNILTNGFTHEYFKNNEKHIDTVLCTLASPWFVSTTKDVHIQDKKIFTVSKAFIDSVVSHEAELYSQELHGGSEGELFMEELDVVEKSITHITINGYLIDNPIDQKTNSLTASIYFGVIPKKIREAIENNIVSILHIPKRSVLFHTFPLVSFSVLRDFFPKEQNYLLFDIAGETTDISLVLDGVLHKTVTFPSAKNFLLRHIASVCDVPIEVAKTYLKMYIEDRATEDLRTQVGKALYDIENEWNIYLADALENLSSKEVLPRKVFLTTDGDTASVFIRYIQVQTTDHTSSWRKGLSVVHIEPKLLSNFVILEPHVPCDEFVAIETIFLHKFQG